ncbi:MULTISPECIES: hypothetical protein [Actinomadura]|uniref:hypothetical protein n=1 Tax=Actinomadura TaxID=1988 RepID=UPI0003FE85CA|nr:MULTISPECIES: hypothetical protein [Actinomadura]RSN68561.1 hypothetical protein DMH08_10395 [Actinomadura sp. WAC 06369]
MPPTDEQIQGLVKKFVALDLRKWDDAEIDQALAFLGWRRAQGKVRGYPVSYCYEDYAAGCHGETHEMYDTGLGPGEVARHGGEYGSEISVGVGKGDDVFGLVREALVDFLGPPSITRGPGPLLRWRDPLRMLEVDRCGEHSTLRVVPTEAVDLEEWRTSKWADEDTGLELLGSWQMVGPGAEWFPGGFWSEEDDWGQFENRLAVILQSVVEELPLLGVSQHFTVVVHLPNEVGFVQWTTYDDWTLRIEASVPRPSPRPGWAEEMAELGWRPWEEDLSLLLVREFPTVGWQEAKTAARMLVGALRSYGGDFEDLWHQVISPDIWLLTIGLPDREGGRF